MTSFNPIAIKPSAFEPSGVADLVFRPKPSGKLPSVQNLLRFHLHLITHMTQSSVLKRLVHLVKGVAATCIAIVAFAAVLTMRSFGVLFGYWPSFGLFAELEMARKTSCEVFDLILVGKKADLLVDPVPTLDLSGEKADLLVDPVPILDLSGKKARPLVDPVLTLDFVEESLSTASAAIAISMPASVSTSTPAEVETHAEISLLPLLDSRAEASVLLPEATGLLQFPKKSFKDALLSNLIS